MYTSTKHNGWTQCKIARRITPAEKTKIRMYEFTRDILIRSLRETNNTDLMSTYMSRLNGWHRCIHLLWEIGYELCIVIFKILYGILLLPPKSTSNLRCSALVNMVKSKSDTTHAAAHPVLNWVVAVCDVQYTDVTQILACYRFSLAEQIWIEFERDGAHSTHTGVWTYISEMGFSSASGGLWHRKLYVCIDLGLYFYVLQPF